MCEMCQDDCNLRLERGTVHDLVNPAREPPIDKDAISEATLLVRLVSEHHW